jgi:general secretion pathway protein F
MTMLFRVRLFDSSALVVRDEIVEADSRAALNLAPLKGTVVSIERVRQLRRLGSRRERLDVAWWCRELRTLLAAGMTVVEAIDTLRTQELGSARAHVHDALAQSLGQGLALSAAMERLDVFPPVLIAGIKAGERTSGLLAALDDYARYHELLDGLRRKVISAAIYPGLVVSLGGAVTLFLLLFVVPRFAKMYGDLRGSMSWTTTALVHLSRFLNNHEFAAIAVAVCALSGLAYWIAQGYAARAAGVVAEHIAPLQRQIDQFRLAKLYHSLALMFRGGYALDDAIRRCTTLQIGDAMTANLKRAATALAHGQRVSSAFSDAHLTDPVTARLLQVGERTGNFDTVLQAIADRHAAAFATFVERVTKIVEPVLLLIVALAVGSIVVLMYMPVFDIATGIR